MLENESRIARVIIATPDDQVLGIRRRSGYFAGKLELPGGRINPQEDLESGLLREVKEETGISLDPRDLTYLFGLGIIDDRKEVPIIGDPPMIGTSLYLYEAKVTPPVTLSPEHDHFRFIDAEEFGKEYRGEGLTGVTDSALAYFFCGMKGIRVGLDRETHLPETDDFESYWGGALERLAALWGVE